MGISFWKCCKKVVSGGSTPDPTPVVRLFGWSAPNAMNFIEAPNAGSPIFSNTIESCLQLGVDIFRTPGGTLGNFAHVPLNGVSDTNYGYGIIGSEAATAPQNVQQIYATDQSTQNPNFIHKQPDIAKKLNAPGIYVANLYTGTTAEILTVLAEWTTQGVPLKWVELGCEGYLYQYNSKYSDPQTYITQAKQFALAIKAVYPTVKVGIVIAPSADMRDPNNQGTPNIRLQAWNDAMFAAIQVPSNDFDALILHSYADKASAFAHLDAVKTFINFIKTFTTAPVWLTEWALASPDTSTLALQQQYYAAMITYLKGEPKITIACCNDLIWNSATDGYNAVRAKTAGTGGSILTNFGTYAATVSR